MAFTGVNKKFGGMLRAGVLEIGSNKETPADLRGQRFIYHQIKRFNRSLENTYQKKNVYGILSTKKADFEIIDS